MCDVCNNAPKPSASCSLVTLDAPRADGWPGCSPHLLLGRAARGLPAVRESPLPADTGTEPEQPWARMGHPHPDLQPEAHSQLPRCSAGRLGLSSLSVVPPDDDLASQLEDGSDLGRSMHMRVRPSSIASLLFVLTDASEPDSWRMHERAVTPCSGMLLAYLPRMAVLETGG